VTFNQIYLLFLDIVTDLGCEEYDDDPNYDGAEFLENKENSETSRDVLAGNK
jgi:hypothetical protein